MFDSPRRHLLVAALATLVIRTAIVLLSPAAFEADPDAYRSLAVSLADSGTFGLKAPDGSPKPTAFRPPLYSLILSSLVARGELSPLAVAALHALLAVATTCFLVLTVRNVIRTSGLQDASRSQHLPLVVSALVAMDPILLRQSTEIMTETLATAIASATLWAWSLWIDATPGKQSWRRAFFLGSALAVAILCRPTFLVWSVLLFAGMLLADRRKRTSMLASGFLVVLCVSGWTARNVLVMGHPIWSTSHGGYTLLLANNELIYDHLESAPLGRVWNPNHFLKAYEHRYEQDPRDAAFWSTDWTEPADELPEVSEWEDDRLCAKAAYATIKRRPKTFLRSAISRVVALWSPIPNATPGRSTRSLAAIASYYIAFYAFAAIAIYRHRKIVFKKEWWAIWLLMLSLTAVHSVYWSNLRMRAPAIPSLALLSSLAIVQRPEKNGERSD